MRKLWLILFVVAGFFEPTPSAQVRRPLEGQPWLSRQSGLRGRKTVGSYEPTMRPPSHTSTVACLPGNVLAASIANLSVGGSGRSIVSRISTALYRLGIRMLRYAGGYEVMAPIGGERNVTP
jgi:hypothetical protein